MLDIKSFRVIFRIWIGIVTIVTCGLVISQIFWIVADHLGLKKTQSNSSSQIKVVVQSQDSSTSKNITVNYEDFKNLVTRDEVFKIVEAEREAIGHSLTMVGWIFALLSGTIGLFGYFSNKDLRENVKNEMEFKVHQEVQKQVDLVVDSVKADIKQHNYFDIVQTSRIIQSEMYRNLGPYQENLVAVYSKLIHEMIPLIPELSQKDKICDKLFEGVNQLRVISLISSLDDNMIKMGLQLFSKKPIVIIKDLLLDKEKDLRLRLANNGPAMMLLDQAIDKAKLL